jgi:RNA 2',3'-cyclic 3'-phosphodiesterase
LNSEVEHGRDEKRRLFIAIPVPERVKETLAKTQGQLKEILAAGSTAWTKPQSMHLTMRFLGDVSLKDIGQISERVRTSLKGFGPVQLICERLGCFPHLRFPRVIWAWVHDAEERIQLFHQRINDAVAEYAEKPAENRFVAHITLARPKQLRRADAEMLARFLDESVALQFGSWQADAVELIHSQLTPQGIRYTTLDVFSL